MLLLLLIFSVFVGNRLIVRSFQSLLLRCLLMLPLLLPPAALMWWILAGDDALANPSLRTLHDHAVLAFPLTQLLYLTLLALVPVFEHRLRRQAVVTDDDQRNPARSKIFNASA